MTEQPPLITNDAVVLGIQLQYWVWYSLLLQVRNLTMILQYCPIGINAIFYSSIFNTFNIISETSVYTIASRYTEFSVTHIKYQFCCFKRLRTKQSYVFLAGTIEIIIGGH
jgi:hypothetical protein